MAQRAMSGRRAMLTAWMVVANAVCGCQATCGTEVVVVDWHLESHLAAPETYPAPDFGSTDLNAVYYDGPQWRGRPTRVFAYFGLPKGASADNQVPGVVCVHGGGGTAFAEWVRVWNRRGFAAIAMDTNGSVPQSPEENPDRFRHPWAGPRRFGFEQALDPPEDHWNYYAVAAVIRANSLLRSQPAVDEDHVGVTGISWGGYKVCIAASLDQRLKFAIPVYGCGFLHDGSSWTKEIEEYGEQKWIAHWDPSSYLRHATLPMLWMNGTNDQHYYLPNFQKSYRLCPQPTLCVPVRMAHGHGVGWRREEIYAFADWAVGKGDALTEIVDAGRDGDQSWVRYRTVPEYPVVAAELAFTTDGGEWHERLWRTIPSRLDADASRATATLPAGTMAYYFQLIDNRGLMVSSQHVEVAGKPTATR